jgi:ribonuclease E
LAQLGARYGLHVLVGRDDALIPPAFRLERLRALAPGETAAPVPLTAPVAEVEEAESDATDGADAATVEASAEEVGEDRRRRSRRRRRRRAPGETGDDVAAETPEPAGEPVVASRAGDGDGDGDADRQRRRRGRRGGRRRVRQPSREPGLAGPSPAAETVEILPTLPVAAAFVGASPMAPEAAIERDAAGETADIETASLPAFAGDKPDSSIDTGARGELHAPQTDRESRRPIAPAAAAIEIVEIAEDAAAAEPPAPPAVAAINGAPQAEALPAWVAGGAAPPHPPGATVQSVTQKPANPRRGWWQRLIQP